MPHSYFSSKRNKFVIGFDDDRLYEELINSEFADLGDIQNGDKIQV